MWLRKPCESWRIGRGCPEGWIPCGPKSRVQVPYQEHTRCLEDAKRRWWLESREPGGAYWKLSQTLQGSQQGIRVMDFLCWKPIHSFSLAEDNSILAVGHCHQPEKVCPPSDSRSFDFLQSRPWSLTSQIQESRWQVRPEFDSPLKIYFWPQGLSPGRGLPMWPYPDGCGSTRGVGRGTGTGWALALLRALIWFCAICPAREGRLVQSDTRGVVCWASESRHQIYCQGGEGCLGKGNSVCKGRTIAPIPAWPHWLNIGFCSLFPARTWRGDGLWVDIVIINN